MKVTGWPYWVGSKSAVTVVVVATGPMPKSTSLTSKKTLPTASTLMRAWDVATKGSVTTAEPVFGAAAASTYGQVLPPSVERLSLTLVVPIGATSVPATFHVTVWLEPSSRVAAVDCEVTRKGPVPGARVSTVSAQPMPWPPRWPSRAVSRKSRRAGLALLAREVPT